jgi:hypothetical protein
MYMFSIWLNWIILYNVYEWKAINKQIQFWLIFFLSEKDILSSFFVGIFIREKTVFPLCYFIFICWYLMCIVIVIGKWKTFNKINLCF